VRRRLFRSAIVGATCGVVALGSAWAVTGLGTPTPPAPGAAVRSTTGAVGSAGASRVGGAAGAAGGLALPAAAPAAGQRLPAGQFLAGGAKVSIAPNPDRWQPNIPAGTCGEDPETYAPRQGRDALRPSTNGKDCLATFDYRWATTVDPLGIWARANAFSNGAQTAVFVTIDGVGWFAAYPADICATCGRDAIAAKVAELTKDDARPVPADNLILGSTHTHAAPNTLAGTPTWYYEQVRDAVTKAAVDAVRSMEPVVLETGATPAKAYNVDRRIVTRAVPDYELGWLRGFQPAVYDKKGKLVSPERTLATLVNFAAHPTVRVSNAELHSGFVGPLANTLEAKLGGTAVWFPGALGDQKVDRSPGTDGLGNGLAALLLDNLSRGYRIQDNTIAVVRTPVAIPGENTFMMAGRGAGLFVRDLLPPYGGAGGPVVTNKRGAPRPSCQTVAELTVNSSVTGIRIGRSGTGAFADPGDGVTIITAPGEPFSSIGLITKDYLSKTRNVLILGLTNDTVGYLIPREQYDETAAQGLGLVHNATDTGNYEEALSLGRCAGDVVQNAMLEAGAALGVMGNGEGR
jgi:hypothetical protein